MRYGNGEDKSGALALMQGYQSITTNISMLVTKWHCLPCWEFSVFSSAFWDMFPPFGVPYCFFEDQYPNVFVDFFVVLLYTIPKIFSLWLDPTSALSSPSSQPENTLRNNTITSLVSTLSARGLARMGYVGFLFYTTARVYVCYMIQSDGRAAG